MVAPVRFVELVKCDSSRFVKTLGVQYTNFYCQRGYRMLSVGPQDRDRKEHDARNQQEHHRQRTFQDEYRAMLSRYGIEFDEQEI